MWKLCVSSSYRCAQVDETTQLIGRNPLCNQDVVCLYAEPGRSLLKRSGFTPIVPASREVRRRVHCAFVMDLQGASLRRSLSSCRESRSGMLARRVAGWDRGQPCTTPHRPAVPQAPASTSPRWYYSRQDLVNHCAGGLVGLVHVTRLMTGRRSYASPLQDAGRANVSAMRNG